WGVNWNLQNQYRADYLYNPNQPDETIQQAITQTYALEGDFGATQQQNRWQGRFSFVFRDKDFAEFFEQLPQDSMSTYQPDAQFQDTTWADRQSHLANFELQYRSHNNEFVSKWNYKVASE
ncbi:MAG: hypothetical protein GWN16_00615, partial [Calditrichae bacterium]|nr:hypothetical protein [Calditrichia bacterium]